MYTYATVVKIQKGKNMKAYRKNGHNSNIYHVDHV